MKEYQQEQLSRIEAPQHDPLVKGVADLERRADDLALRIEAIEAQLANTTQQQAMKEARVPEATTELSEKAEEIRRMYEGMPELVLFRVLASYFTAREKILGLMALAALDKVIEERLYAAMKEATK